jgi:acyl-CoA reductase-like NAD-dependent aldehyde dehydrogenase
MDAATRGHLLHKLANLIERDAVELASLETLVINHKYLKEITNSKKGQWKTI